MRRLTLVRGVWLGLVVAAGPAGESLADKVTLRDGRVYEGTVVEETSGTVVIETTVSGITTKLELSRRDVYSVEIDPKSDGAAEDTGEDEAGEKAEDVRPSRGELRERLRTATPRDRDRRGSEKGEGPSEGRFMVIPAEGVIGVDVTAPGIADALDDAERLGAEHVVFVIDSPGGYVYEALAIRELLLESRERFTLHAYVSKQAISAATVLAAGSSTISMAPSATIGGATSYSVKAETGSAEVDAKMNSIWAAEMASIASTCGHDEAPFRAMIEQERELYVLRDGSGGVTLSASPPPAGDGRRWERVDDMGTILTMTASQVRDFGIGGIVDGGAEALGAALGLDGWHAASDDGSRAMQKAAREREQLGEALERAAEQLFELADDAKKYHPLQITVVYDPNTLLISEDTRRKWSRAASRASSAWRRVERMMDKFMLLKRKADDLGALHLSVADEDIEEIRALAREHLDWLHEHGRAPRTIADVPNADD